MSDGALRAGDGAPRAGDGARAHHGGDGPAAHRGGDRPAAHPGPRTVGLPASIRAALVDHARAESPNESCGLIVGDALAADGGRPLRFEPTRNAAASPYRYEIDSGDLLRLTLEADERDEAFWGIVHSHVRTPARPSPTDIGLAFYPDALYVLVSLADEEADPVTGRASVRAWRIVDGAVHEVGIEDGE